MYSNSQGQGLPNRSYGMQSSSRGRSSQSPVGSRPKSFYPTRHSEMQQGEESFNSSSGRGRSPPPPPRNYHHPPGPQMEGRGRSRSPRRAPNTRDQSPPFYSSFRTQSRGGRMDFSPSRMDQRGPRSPQRYSRYPDASYQRQYNSAPPMDYRRQPTRSPSPSRNYPSQGPTPIGHYDRTASYSKSMPYRDVGRKEYSYRRSPSPPMNRDYGNSQHIPYVNPYEFRRPQSPYHGHPHARAGGYRESSGGFDDSQRNSRGYSGSRSSGSSYYGTRKSPAPIDRGTEADRMESKTLFVGNIPYTFSEDDLKELFEKLGKLVNVAIPLDRQTGRNKGFAFVEYEDRRDAEDAFQKYQGYQIQDRSLKIDWDIGREKKTHLKPHGNLRETNIDAESGSLEQNNDYQTDSITGSLNEEQSLGNLPQPSSFNPDEPGWGN